MKFFANGDTITKRAETPGDGWVEISAEDYAAAKEAKLTEGREAVVVDGGLVIRERAPSPKHEWQNGQWHEPALEPEPEPGPPEVVSMRQARLALLQAGHLAAVEPALDALPSPQKEAALIEWEYAAEMRRDHPLIAQLAAALGLSSEEVDDLFRLAATL